MVIDPAYTLTPPSLTTLATPPARLRPAVSRRVTSPDAVVLRPLVPPANPVCSGYLAGFARRSADEELPTLRWTLQALEVLAPDSFLAARLSASTVCQPSFARLVGEAGPSRLLPILTAARVGGRLAELSEARRSLHRLDMRVAVSGHRIGSPGDFDAVLAAPPFAFDLSPAGKMLIVTGLSSADEISWAEDRGADLLEGEAVAEAIRVAPVDLKRLRR